ncbi:MAG: cation:proton antiporter, partial [Candidatus Thorarchaeota archaeon]
LAAVLFYAGLTMNLRELRSSLTSILLLATLGVLLTSLIAGATILLFSLLTTYFLAAFLIGAILSPTDPAALFSILETGGVRVKKKINSILEGEAVFNDATSVILVITVFLPLVAPSLGADQTWYSVLGGFTGSMILGVVIGFGVAYLIGWIMLHTGEDTTVSILTATTPILAYGVGEIFVLWGFHPGALAAVFTGIFMANSRGIGLEALPQRSMRGIMKNVSFVFEIIVFILFGFTLNTTFIFLNPNVITVGLIVAGLVILVARPASVFLVTAFDRSMTFKDRFLISWAGVKGVASAALAAIAVTIIGHEIPGSEVLVDTINSIVFVVVIISLLFQGLTTPIFARRLGLVEKQDTAREITAHRDATRHALLELVDQYTEGKVESSLYTRMKSELEEEIFTLEDELRKYVSEKRARLNELKVREEVSRSKLEFYQTQYELGSIPEIVFEDRKTELEMEIEEIMNRRRAWERGPEN